MAPTTPAPEAAAPLPAMRVGTAGWSLPRESWPHFPGEGTHLQRYAGVFGMAEIDTSFYRPHQPGTYARWAGSTPAHFRFSVKLPREITHERALRDVDEPLAAFMAQVEALGPRLGCLLVQLAPSLVFDSATVDAFLALLRQRHAGQVALEPRHASWFERAAHELLAAHRVGRVLADPVRERGGESPGGWRGLAYLRLHGAPRTYYSGYSQDGLADWARLLRQYQDAGAECWCVLDNTAAGRAVPDALALQALLRASSR